MESTPENRHLNFRSKPITILYEDNHILAVVKPASLLAQADATQRPDLQSILKAYIKEKYNKSGSVFLPYVHRLDRSAGGVMLFARTSKAASRLGESFRNGSVVKVYRAIVEGDLEKRYPLQGGFKDLIKKDTEQKLALKAKDDDPDKKEASLSYQVIERLPFANNEQLTHLQVTLHTGRFHQIRYQFASRGFPLVGDNRYGSRCISQKIDPSYKNGEMIALFAESLTFPHPIGKEKITLTASLPAEFLRLLSSYPNKSN